MLILITATDNYRLSSPEPALYSGEWIIGYFSAGGEVYNLSPPAFLRLWRTPSWGAVEQQGDEEERGCRYNHQPRESWAEGPNKDSEDGKRECRQHVLSGAEMLEVRGERGLVTAGGIATARHAWPETAKSSTWDRIGLGLILAP